MKKPTPTYDAIVAMATIRNYAGTSKHKRLYPTYTKLEKSFLAQVKARSGK